MPDVIVSRTAARDEVNPPFVERSVALPVRKAITHGA